MTQDDIILLSISKGDKKYTSAFHVNQLDDMIKGDYFKKERVDTSDKRSTLAEDIKEALSI